MTPEEDRHWPLVVLAVIALLGCACVWYATPTVEGAPAPRYVEPPPRAFDPRASMELSWGGGGYAPLVLSPEGRYSWGAWEGGYRWDADSSTLTVWESMAGTVDPVPCVWRVALDADGRGVIEGQDYAGTKLHVRRPEAKRVPPARPAD